ncbi:PREDICTED: sesquipedalian-1-like isoform X1 [Cyprinodon variegatus]|uniref:sesquipedalian-1-like isoform X1 n=1 Tax=Cyprinodon variegatus TaxID=28743 RepID=UPI0007428F71|nr:PREDICTED: sesquipedalian-1-like isoform X1 [Cyprinodon variegatus]XP_015231447.1 PREDICTED: sesquipedalian-1-like isoform X1 [Cyprinodon variegatus]XP_015231449.1 PREDICTED: sesquipedalian-1-like isoform X1 [Cyprinodon variegatus]
MKIDEKVVSYFESCSSPVDKEGYLSKKGEIKTSYQKRWFVLKGNLLFYKDRPGDKDLIGVIVLEGCTVQLCESEEQFAFSIVWSEPGLRTYKFAAEDQASQESWIKALLSASHSYLALLVTDMEKQYKDALNAHSSELRRPFTMPNFHSIGPNYPTTLPSTQASILPSSAGQSLGPGASLSSNHALQVSSISASRAVSKKSPKLWPKKSSNMVSVSSTPALPLFDSLCLSLDPEEDFNKMHEDFGKEVKKLICDWSRKRGGGELAAEESLIDFG